MEDGIQYTALVAVTSAGYIIELQVSYFELYYPFKGQNVSK
jgi:hypothetical protein